MNHIETYTSSLFFKPIHIAHEGVAKQLKAKNQIEWVFRQFLNKQNLLLYEHKTNVFPYFSDVLNQRFHLLSTRHHKDASNMNKTN